MKCPNCEKEFYNNDTSGNCCPYCGYSFVEKEIIQGSHQENTNQKQNNKHNTSDKKDTIIGKKCEVCGYVNKKNLNYCEQCGRQLPITSIKCPNCGSDFKGRKCSKCGYQLSQVNTNQYNGKDNSSESDKILILNHKRICVNCGHVNYDDDSDYCEKCGNPIEYNVCPVCGGYSEGKTCNTCGYDLENSNVNGSNEDTNLLLMKNIYGLKQANEHLNSMHNLLILLVILVIIICFFLVIIYNKMW